jgi:hypothetical protein
MVAVTPEQQHPFLKAAHNSIVGVCAQGVSRVVDLFCLELGSTSLIAFCLPILNFLAPPRVSVESKRDQELISERLVESH